MTELRGEKFIKLSNALHEAIMQSDFSKRQRKILDLILRLSYGCRKEVALIKPSDFEIVGVRKGHIRKELDHLVRSNVIFMDGEMIQINKNSDQWEMSIVTCFDQEKLNQLIRRNLTQPKVTETVTEVTEMVTDHGQDEVTKMGTEVTETVTKVTEMVTDQEGRLPKQELNSYQNSNSAVTKMVTDTGSNPNGHKEYSAPKDILKTIKDKELLQQPPVESDDSVVVVGNQKEVTNKDLIHELVSEYRELNEVSATKGDYSFIGSLYNKHGYNDVYNAIDVLGRKLVVESIQKPLLYLQGILSRGTQPNNVTPFPRKEGASNYWQEQRQREEELERKRIEHTDYVMACNLFWNSGFKPGLHNHLFGPWFKNGAKESELEELKDRFLQQEYA